MSDKRIGACCECCGPIFESNIEHDADGTPMCAECYEALQTEVEPELPTVRREHLRMWKACDDGFRFWCEHCDGITTMKQISILRVRNQSWALWLIDKLLPTLDRVRLACFVIRRDVDSYPDTKLRSSIHRLTTDLYLTERWIESGFGAMPRVSIGHRHLLTNSLYAANWVTTWGPGQDSGTTWDAIIDKGIELLIADRDEL